MLAPARRGDARVSVSRARGTGFRGRGCERSSAQQITVVAANAPQRGDWWSYAGRGAFTTGRAPALETALPDAGGGRAGRRSIGSGVSAGLEGRAPVTAAWPEAVANDPSPFSLRGPRPRGAPSNDWRAATGCRRVDGSIHRPCVSSANRTPFPGQWNRGDPPAPCRSPEHGRLRRAPSPARKSWRPWARVTPPAHPLGVASGRTPDIEQEKRKWADELRDHYTMDRFEDADSGVALVVFDDQGKNCAAPRTGKSSKGAARASSSRARLGTSAAVRRPGRAPEAIRRARSNAYFDGDRGRAVGRQSNVAPRGTRFFRRAVYGTALSNDSPAGTTMGTLRRAPRDGPSAAPEGRQRGRGFSRTTGTRSPVVVPCHRGHRAADGTAHRYAGGLDRKRWLLRFTRAAKTRGQPEWIASTALAELDVFGRTASRRRAHQRRADNRLKEGAVDGGELRQDSLQG